MLREHEGIYTCEAWSSETMVRTASTMLKLLYPPTTIYPETLKHAVNSTEQSWLKRADKISDVLNDHVMNGQLGNEQPSEELENYQSNGQDIFCYLHSSPLPRRVFWERVPGDSLQACSPTSNSINSHSTCSCSSGHSLAAADSTEENSLNNGMSASILTGQAALEYITSHANASNLDFTETLVVARLSYPAHLQPELGLYAAYLENDQGCGTCYVHVQNYAVPEAPTEISVRNLSWDRILLSWLPGYNGGFEQKIVLKASSLENPNAIVGDEMVVISNVPVYPERQQCWLSGLQPNITYHLMFYGKNKLGRGPTSEAIVFKTNEILFPRLVNFERNSVELELQIEGPASMMEKYCIQIEERTPFVFHLSPLIYDTCPRISAKQFSGLSVERCEHISRPSNLRSPPISQNVSVESTMEMRIMEHLHIAVNASKAVLVPNATTGYKNIRGAENVVPVGYRLRFCVLHKPYVCSNYISLQKTSKSNSTNFPLLWICLNATVFPVFCLLIAWLWHVHRRRKRTREELWVTRKSKHSTQTSVPMKIKSSSPQTSSKAETVNLNQLGTNVDQHLKQFPDEVSSREKLIELILPKCSPLDITTSVFTPRGLDVHMFPCPYTEGTEKTGGGISPMFYDPKPPIKPQSQIILTSSIHATSMSSPNVSSVVLLPSTPGFAIDYAEKALESSDLPLLFHLPVQINTLSTDLSVDENYSFPV